MFLAIFSRSLLAASLALTALLGTRFGDPSPSRAVTNSPSVEAGWAGGFVVDGVDNIAAAVAVDGNRVYIGGSFSVAGDVQANNVAMWDGSAWAPLGDGLDGKVLTIALDGRGNLYAGGGFAHAGGITVNNIARWDGQDWHALGGGTDYEVYAIAVDSAGRVFAGGDFERAGGANASHIAIWDGTSWQMVGGGVSFDNSNSPRVFALAFDRFGFLYAGGSFNHAGGIAANNIARWDGMSWSSLGDGVSGDAKFLNAVHSLAIDGRGNLYAGGRFATAGAVSAENIARWNGESWSALGGGIQSSEYALSPVSSIVADGEDIYAGGDFYAAGGNAVGSLARWNGSAWDAMGGGAWQDNYPAVVSGMAINRDGWMFIAGDFATAGGMCAHSVAAWDRAAWHGLGISTSTDGAITAMMSDQQGGYYVAGNFVCAGGKVVKHITHWDGVNWSPLGTGLSGWTEGVWPRSIALDSQGNVYVGGLFDQAGNTLAYNVAKWNGSDWEALGDSLGGYFVTLAVDRQDRLYAGGSYYIWGSGDPGQYSAIFRWDGSQWEDLHSGINGMVDVLEFDDQGRLVAGGYFGSAGGIIAQGIARWDGQAWEALCNCSLLHEPFSLLIDGDVIYAGTDTIHKIQDGSIELVGGGISFPGYKYPNVNALALDQKNRLVVGGIFNKAWQADVQNIARWDGEKWESFNGGIAISGTYPGVTFISQMENGKLLVAGGFYQSGGKVSRNLAMWTEPNYLWFPYVSW